MSSHHFIGAHEIWQEDDIVCVRYNGPINKAEILEIFEFIDAAARRHGEVYLLVDSNRGVLPPLEVRRVMAERGYERVRGLVRYQHGPAVNSWLTLLLQNASRLIGRPTTRTKVVSTEAEARAWLDELRQQKHAVRS